MSSNARPHPIRVVTLVDRLVQGGAERLAVDVTTRLDPVEFDRTICVTRWSDAGHARYGEAVERWRGEIEQAGVGFLGLERRGAWDLPAWRPLVKLLKDTDVVHAHMFGSSVWGVVLGRLARVPVIVSHEHSWSFDTDQRARMLADRFLIAGGSSTLIACSREDQRRMVDLEKIKPEQITFLPNGIEARPPTPGRDLRAELGIAADTPVVGAVGSLRVEKRFDLLVRAAAHLKEAVPGARLLIAGDGPERETIEALIAELGVGDVVTLLGARTDVPDVLAALDVAVNCSDSEGSPLAVMEYMEAGRAVVGTRVGGVPDLIEHGTHGLLVGPGDHIGLARAIGELLADPERRARMGEAAQQRRRAEFDLSTMVGNVEQLYRTLLAARPASR